MKSETTCKNSAHLHEKKKTKIRHRMVMLRRLQLQVCVCVVESTQNYVFSEKLAARLSSSHAATKEKVITLSQNNNQPKQ